MTSLKDWPECSRIYLKGVVTNMRYSTRSEFCSLVHKNNFKKETLALRWLLLFQTCQRNSVCEWIQTWNKMKHFHLFLILMFKKLGSFNVKLILFMNNFYKHIFRSSRLQMFFKISALENFTILRIKKRLQHRCFHVKSCHKVLTYW